MRICGMATPSRAYSQSTRMPLFASGLYSDVTEQPGAKMHVHPSRLRDQPQTPRIRTDSMVQSLLSLVGTESHPKAPPL